MLPVHVIIYFACYIEIILFTTDYFFLIFFNCMKRSFWELYRGFQNISGCNYPLSGSKSMKTLILMSSFSIRANFLLFGRFVPLFVLLVWVISADTMNRRDQHIRTCSMAWETNRFPSDRSQSIL
ncbi:MAG: hypothetical protein DRQ98_04905 [Gammaproteobacteria bacterium]|nr:MAG: hypothetical protein DRQ98_04905 [Gammaproteobacteria bacterium]